jgi:transposase-like protein
MFTQPKKCPSAECGAIGKFFIKKGYFKTKWNAQPVPRYRCKKCGKFFSSHTLRPTAGQKKPHLNHEIYKLYASGMTQKRLAQVLGCNPKTVARKVLFIAWEARKHHESVVAKGGLQTSYAQFDEMETFEHTRLKPLSIALAVRGKTGEIVEARVAEMNCHGKSASTSQRKYGWRTDTRDAAREDVFKMLNKCRKSTLTIISDAKTDYPKLAKKLIPDVTFVQVPSRVAKAGGPDKMFTLNYTAAKIRNDLSRMARKTWVTTKKAEMLQAHLDLYIAWNNGYKIFHSKSGAV